MTSEAQKRSVRKYDQGNTIQIKMKLNRRTDKAIIDKLEMVGNKQGYIKQLIKKDMEENKMEYLKNSYDHELEIYSLENAKQYFRQDVNAEWFTDEERKFNEELESCADLREVAEVLNKWTDIIGNGSQYTVTKEEENKMKKEFTVNVYTAEITKRKLKELLSGKDITQYEHILTDYAINNDTCPDIIGTYETKEAAQRASCPNGEITLFPAAVSYYRICCNGIIEEYNISEDDTAEFVDMDYSGKMFSQEELKKLREDLF